MSYFLCVDCGGSKTAAVIADSDGNIVGQGYAGPSNLTYLSTETYLSAVKAAVAEALGAASLPTELPPVGPAPFVTAWLGASGADAPSVIESVKAPVASLLDIPVGPNLVVANDTHLLAAPIHLYDDVSRAVCIIAGTGAIAVSFEAVDGQIFERCRSGGWGWILGDEGGGYDVGREAIRQILATSDRAAVEKVAAPHSTLTEKVMSRFGITNVMDVLRCIYLPDPVPDAVVGPNASPAEFAREKRLSTLSPMVFEAAFEDNDPLAMEVLKKCVSTLVETASVVLGTSAEDRPGAVLSQDAVLSFGGSLLGVERYRQMVVDGLKERGFVFKHVIYVSDAAKTGAVALSAAAKRL
ncbi:hypothetical protein P691DRAFT_137807 [Macrolepiota fuliginosa MF-IS2]|uniref:N-acetyl-D-glucosamine kinase n=1 Tax=Macrolepiota fuliginosa MF-IS2 TaxID=1400762 RepID=A0A9P5XC92_9AGAR|nr:hypothetical protein P691DRAFT_137807 [Macrolepiota fuliginosa MF-IS2]